MRNHVLLLTAATVADAQGGWWPPPVPPPPCEYQKPTAYENLVDLAADLQANGGCKTDPKPNGHFDCSLPCARHYFPIEKRCRTLFAKLNLGQFTEDCRHFKAPGPEAPHGKEWGIRCRDHKDNDHV